MPIYTITPNFLESIETIYFTDVLFIFANRGNPYKIAVDKDLQVIKIYESIENDNKDIIKTWLDLMTFVPRPFEKINVGIKDIPCLETAFLKICKETVGCNKIVFYSKQDINNYKCINNYITFEEKKILVLDRDEVRSMLNTNTINNVSNSILALNGSNIHDAKLNSVKK